MIEKTLLKSLVEEWLEDKDYFLVDLTVSPDDRINVEIDHKEGVWIDDCVQLSKHIEGHLDREESDFELEVGSAGIGQPFKILKQYEIHQGGMIDVLLANGQRLSGLLKEVGPENFVVTITEKVKLEGKKRPEMVERDVELRYDEVKETRERLDFK